MKNILWLTRLLSLICLLFFSVTCSITPGTAQYKVLTLGNSITQGNTEFPGYRYPLWKMLVDEGMDVELVGSHDTNEGGDPAVKGTVYNGKVYTNRNEGHWGWSTDEILNGRDIMTGNLASWLEDYTPDIALIHLGTNDMFRQCGGNPNCYEETISELREVVRVLRNDNANIKIFMAQLIPADPQKVGPAIAQNIERLNALIPALVNDLNTTRSPVVLVDQFTGFNPTMGVDTHDGVHPNTSGELKMASKWFAAIEPSITPLPVELSSFTARSTSQGFVQLAWTTASEQDNAFFEVQHSSDGTTFTARSQVKGAGTTATAQQYTYTDSVAANGPNYYRLKQVDTDGTSSYSKVVQVEVAEKAQALKVYPTKSNGAAHVTLHLQHNDPTAETAVDVYTSEGRLVHRQQGLQSRGSSLLTRIPINLLHGAGLYFVRVMTGGSVYTSKFIVE
ncbi:GDSL-type esterase/lipase family protein [Pontibacter akesuensis]|uniref:Por secretion system C-terminal sorting domain-containing protein n=1 Tax=Pontibacter akesuensis TaxID=388950 RepID=A0A1I7K7K1_9BACT|nr:GDSL-type esterase/lipase family protein [Pontibacter akesuensis]GHA74509.1 hypothetical protein GCM10007389_30300 [Pontibacter akesuensis]SFU93389.1 Por secretion system C-terminal sorting domain-containing protein [Pontibacter akesuensis]